MHYHTPMRPAYFSLLLIPFIASCSLLQDSKPKRTKQAAAKTQVEFQADDVLYHLSLAVLTLDANAPDVSAAASNLETLQELTAKPEKRVAKKTKNSARIEAVVLECKSKSEGNIKLAAAHNTLSEILMRMEAKSCKLYNVWPSSVTVNREPPLSFSNMSAGQARQLVRDRMSGVVRSAARLSPLEDAKAQLDLTRFFIDTRQRDAAYLSVENAKHSLAAAENAKGDKAQIEELLKQLEALESEIRKVMPFTL